MMKRLLGIIVALVLASPAWAAGSSWLATIPTTGNTAAFFGYCVGGSGTNCTGGSFWAGTVIGNSSGTELFTGTNPAAIYGGQPASVTMQSAAVANGNGTALTVTGYQTALVNVNCSVACSGGTTINFEGTDSTGTYFSIAAIPVTGQTNAVSTAITSGQFWVPVGGLTTIRARISAYSAGTITITGTAIYGQNSTIAQIANATNLGPAAAASANPVTPSNLAVGAAAFAATQVSVASTATLIVSARTGVSGTGRVAVTITNTTTTAIYLGGSGVTTSTGTLLPGIVGASVTINTTAAVYGIVASGTATVTAFETY